LLTEDSFPAGHIRIGPKHVMSLFLHGFWHASFRREAYRTSTASQRAFSCGRLVGVDSQYACTGKIYLFPALQRHNCTAFLVEFAEASKKKEKQK
jgi:hypothetical protein